MQLHVLSLRRLSPMQLHVLSLMQKGMDPVATFVGAMYAVLNNYLQAEKQK